MSQLLLRLNIQMFADGEETETVVETTQDDNLSGEELLQKAIQDLLAEETPDDDIESEETEPEPEQEEEPEPEKEKDTELEPEPTDDEKGQKRVQSQEENSKFAAQRREQEIQQKVQAELERLKKESPEYQLAKVMADMYGVTPEVALQQMKDEALKQQAEKQGVPIEVLKKQEESNNRVTQLEQEINQMRYQNWQQQVDADSEKLQTQYKFLTKEDMDAAVQYIFNNNINISMEQAVYAVHGAKIVENLANNKVQTNLAEQSGRKAKTPPAPNNGKPTKVVQATADERYVAKAMGMTIEEYLKYK